MRNQTSLNEFGQNFFYFLRDVVYTWGPGRPFSPTGPGGP